jgi:hypothetical protein
MIIFNNFSFQSLVFIALLVSTPAAHGVGTPEKDTGNLGEIRQSILNVEQFQRMYGDGWVLLKGQSAEEIRASDLVSLGYWPENTPLPDARGIFLRSKHHDRSDGTGNPDGDLPVGTYQESQFQRHDHSGGDHSHPLPLDLWQPQGPVKNHLRVKSSTSQHLPFDCTGQSGRIIAPEGGNETRPRCVTVNTFIKIDRTENNQHTNRILEVMEDVPRRLIENPDFLVAIRQMVQQENARAIETTAEEEEASEGGTFAAAEGGGPL